MADRHVNLFATRKDFTNIDEIIERAELNTFVAYLQESTDAQMKERQLNIAPNRPSEADLLHYNSRVKENAAFVKRLKQFTAQELPSLLRDVSRLNLTKYISEVSAALVEQHLKMSDVDAALTLCSHLHRKYANFAPTMFESWHKLLSIKPRHMVTNPSKMCVDLRFFGELISVGIFPHELGIPLLRDCLVGLMEGRKTMHSNLLVVLSFYKHFAYKFIYLVPTRIKMLIDKYGVSIPVPLLLPPRDQCMLSCLISEYYRSLLKHLQSENKKLQLTKKSLQKIAKDEIITKEHEYKKLSTLTKSVAELLGEKFPLFEKLEQSDAKDEQSDGMLRNEIFDPWRDREVKSVCVDWPDWNHILPSYCKIKQDDDDHYKKAETHGRNLTVVDGNDKWMTVLDSRRYLDKFVQKLQRCVKTEMIDKAAIEFLEHLNIKGVRDQLATVLFEAPRTRLDLLPVYARFVAIINLVSSDVVQQLCNMLNMDFYYDLNIINKIKIESQIKSVRYIGELVKFGIYRKEDALRCLHCLLENFQHHNVEMACALLEVCGVYLFNCPASRKRVATILKEMMRLKKTTKMLDRHEQMVDDVYYLVKGPVTSREEQKTLPISHIYVWRLVFRELGKSNVDSIVTLFCRLNWDDVDLADYAVQCLSQAYNVQQNVIPSLANTLMGLQKYQEQAVVRVIDAVLKEIRAIMKINKIVLGQQLIAMVTYLGELYNYQVVESDIIFNILYSTVSLGVNPSHYEPSASGIELPISLFWVKMACVLLNTCGHYFNIGHERNRLDHFLVFFQQYYWHKKSHPILAKPRRGDGVNDRLHLYLVILDHMYHDCLKNLRPDLKLYSSFEEAKNAAEKIRQEYFNGIDEGADIEDSQLLLDFISNVLSDEKKDVYIDNDRKGLELSVQKQSEDLALKQELERIMSKSCQQWAAVKAKLANAKQQLNKMSYVPQYNRIEQHAPKQEQEKFDSVKSLESERWKKVNNEGDKHKFCANRTGTMKDYLEWRLLSNPIHFPEK